MKFLAPFKAICVGLHKSLRINSNTYFTFYAFLDSNFLSVLLSCNTAFTKLHHLNSQIPKTIRFLCKILRPEIFLGQYLTCHNIYVWLFDCLWPQQQHLWSNDPTHMKLKILQFIACRIAFGTSQTYIQYIGIFVRIEVIIINIPHLDSHLRL